MALHRLNEASSGKFVAAPEDAMGYHLGEIGGRACLVMAGIVAIVPGGGDLEGTRAALAELGADLPAPDPRTPRCEPLSFRWRREGRLADDQFIEPLSKYLSALVGPLPSPVAPSVYGHIPFQAAPQGPTVCYRFECFSTSLRISRATGQVAAGTFASPFLEAPFIASGFAAVARCALPNLRPHRWRYELAAPPGTTLHCGAVVPMFGQSGGGVELHFPNGFTNLGPIAPPVVLPEY